LEIVMKIPWNIPRSNVIWASCIGAAVLLTGGMALGQPEGPVRMSAMKISSLDGFAVDDWNGDRVGQIASVETDDQGRTRWLLIDLASGGTARVASFRADLDVRKHLVSIRLPAGQLMVRAQARASALAAAVSSPSA
jgi:hypothetical protein